MPSGSSAKAQNTTATDLKRSLASFTHPAHSERADGLHGTATGKGYVGLIT